MNVAVLVKQVPQVDSLELGPGGRLRRAHVVLEMNPYCRRAVSQGVELVRHLGGRRAAGTGTNGPGPSRSQLGRCRHRTGRSPDRRASRPSLRRVRSPHGGRRGIADVGLRGRRRLQEAAPRAPGRDVGSRASVPASQGPAAAASRGARHTPAPVRRRRSRTRPVGRGRKPDGSWRDPRPRRGAMPAAWSARSQRSQDGSSPK